MKGNKKKPLQKRLLNKLWVWWTEIPNDPTEQIRRAKQYIFTSYVLIGISILIVVVNIWLWIQRCQ